MDELSNLRFMTFLSLGFLFIKKQIIIEETRTKTKIISNSKYLWGINLKTHMILNTKLSTQFLLNNYSVKRKVIE